MNPSELEKLRTPKKTLPLDTIQMPELTIEISSDEEEDPIPREGFVDSGAM